MARRRVACLALVLVLSTLSILVSISPPASALTRTWTSEADFNEPGADFNGVEVVSGPGPTASLQLLKDDMDWANKNPATWPGPREGPALAYSAATGVTVLFGGYDGIFYSDETWEYDSGTNTWTMVTPGTRPAGREAAGMSYDSVAGVVILYGGFNSDGTLTDTWEYDAVARTWTQRMPASSPPPMASIALAYDESALRHILVGWNTGQDRFETWAYDAAQVTWELRTTGGPANRGGHALTYHADRGAIVLHGGGHPLPFPQGTLYGDTWEYGYGANSWTLTVPAASGPPARASHVMTYERALRSALLFGGSAPGVLFEDTWRYFSDPGTGAPTWEIVTTQTSPPARRLTGMTFDAGNNVTVLYGGVDAASVIFEDTWTLGSAYRAAGRYTSAVFDSGGASVDWQTLWFNQTPPVNTILRFQLAASISPTGPWSFLGPTCQATTYYTAPGQAICASQDGNRYLRWLADFGTFDPQVSPVLDDLTINYVVPPQPPYIVSTDPADGDVDVPVDKVVRIVFSEPMDTPSVTWSFLAGPPVTFLPVWSAGDSILDLTHPSEPFAENRVYRLRIAGSDKQGDALVGGPVPNPFLFVTQATLPYIVGTSPVQGDTNVLLTAPIVATFSEPMNTASLTWTITPDLVLTPQWNPTEDVVTFSHVTNFQQCIEYEVSVDARDKAGLQLVPGPAPNPWTFVTECVNPYVVATDPVNLQGDVPLNYWVVVDFSEPMDTATVTFTIVPSVGGQSLRWTNGDRRLNMTHTALYTGCTAYEVTVAGNDVDGNPLISGPPGSPPNPWKFITLCDNPMILITNPADGEQNVEQSRFIRIAFSETMDTASVQYTVTPSIVVTQDRWSAGVMLTIEHIGFAQCERYEVNVVQGRNAAGFPLIPGPVPNPWSFETICESPYVTDTNPADGDTLVPLDAPIWVNFSEPMETATVSVVIAPGIALTRTWSNNDQTLMLTHTTDFLDCQQYTVDVDGRGKDGNNLVKPGPAAPATWSFTSQCAGFYILRTDPVDGEQNVPFDRSIVVEFSQPADPSTFQITLVPSVPLTPTWSAGNTIVTLAHTEPFSECTVHSATVSAKNETGSDLINVPGSKPNPWTFKTSCVAPYITATDPMDGAVGVPLDAPICIDFSEPMDTATVMVTIVPSIPLTAAWSAGDTRLCLTHVTPFSAGTRYTVTVTGNDKDGNALVPGPVPNPWSFTTRLGLTAPGGLQVTRMPPADILLTWRSVPGAARYTIYSSLNRFAAWPWPEIGDIVAPGTSFFASGHYADGVTHYYIVRAKDAGGGESPNSTMGVKTPLAFSFGALRSNIHWISLPYRTMYGRASDISDELTSARIDVVAKWDPATQRSILWYYFRGQWRGTNFPITPGDGLYLGVRASFDWIVNGTDGSVPLSFAPSPAGNVNWISLPYTSAYARASDIVLDIEGSIGPGANTKIVEIAKWDAVTQTVVIFAWSPAGWTGTNFSILLGEGVYFRVVSAFTWTPRLITPEVP